MAESVTRSGGGLGASNTGIASGEHPVRYPNPGREQAGGMAILTQAEQHQIEFPLATELPPHKPGAGVHRVRRE
jgi:hypothetical protein